MQHQYGQTRTGLRNVKLDTARLDVAMLDTLDMRRRRLIAHRTSLRTELVGPQEEHTCRPNVPVTVATFRPGRYAPRFMDRDLESEPGIEGPAGLAALSATGRAALAAACAQRLLPLYVEYVRRTGDGDAAAVSGHLDLLWTVLAYRTDVTAGAEDPDPWADEVER